MTNSTIILIRHGETVWNVEGKMQGHGDSPLTDLGIAQAQAVGERLRHAAFTTLYASDLGRTMDTARYIATVTGHEIVPDQRLRERNVGTFQGITVREAREKYPDLWHSTDPHTAAPNGESSHELRMRAMDVLDDLASRHPGESIAVVTHGGFLSVALRYILGTPADQQRRFRVFNAAINIIAKAQDDWSIYTLGEIHHLHHLTAKDHTAQ